MFRHLLLSNVMCSNELNFFLILQDQQVFLVELQMNLQFCDVLLEMREQW